MNIKFISTCFIAALTTLSCAREGNPYMRVRDGFLQVASKSFLPANGNGPKITLSGAIHIGEESFYEQLQERLDKADAVLYESIGLHSEKKEIKENCPQFLDKSGGHGKTAKQLNLVCQTRHIKKRGHFVHADISLATFLDHLKVAEGEDLCQRLEKAPKPPSSDATESSMDASKLRNMTALSVIKDLNHEREYANENKDMLFLLFKRNEFVMDTLKRELPRFTAEQEIAIFYGAGHLPDIEASLRDMGYQLHSSEWLSAFSL